MAKVPKNKKVKRPTVLTKRPQRIKPQKKKAPMPLYQKMKANNHLLATALNQEKQESQLLFSKNTELMAEIQDLNLACRTRDTLLHNILTNAKEMMQTIVTMSGFLSNTISSCNEILSNQNYVNHSRRTSSPCRRESVKRLSMKSPAKGVVKPMVSGHTITKPTINLSRVHMPRPPISNLSLIEERPSTPDGSPPENRHSRSEILPLALNRNQEEEEGLINNRRTSRLSTNRLSSGGRYSKRKSSRLSGRLSLSKRQSDYPEIKSPKVHLQDISRFLSNNQTTISANLFADISRRFSESNHSSQDVSQNDANSDYLDENRVIIPETQESQDSSSESGNENSLNLSSNTISTQAEIHQSLIRKSNQPLMESHLIDPMEGSSWMFDSTQNDIDVDEDQENRPPPDHNKTVEDRNGATSPVSTFPCSTNSARRSSLFRVPDLPKAFGRRNPVRDSLNASLSSPTPLGTVLDTSTYPSANDNDDTDDDHDDESDQNEGDDDDDEDYADRRMVHFVTERRGPSSRTSSRRYGSEKAPNNNAYQDDDDDDDDETLMINMRNQLKPRFAAQSNLDERPERLQFDVNELLQLTPLKPLMKMNGRTNAGPALMAQQDNDEPTATIQLTERPGRPAAEDTDTLTMSRMSTQRVPRQWQHEESSTTTVRCQDQRAQNKRFSELTTERLSRSRIELPRMTEMLDYTANQTQIIKTPDVSKSKENPKRRKAVKKKAVSDDEWSDQPEKKTRQRKTKAKDKENKKKDSVQNENNENDSSVRRSSSRLQETVRTSSSSSVASYRSSLLQPAEQSSDSESSVASNRPLSTRPRRKKAPTNLHEPSLIKKLRRG
ncbi:uncharacterized protein LOC106649588 [Trichogramma pretiosum]|uniref:uncharacterized protein LOC106649588 n=1 Tax=Trichogramma pretiosum TaxID=7493 RepID=UPI0006C95F59|nr:uncharacterized protein LOC106649588 [Trichogramma pretiosum]